MEGYKEPFNRCCYPWGREDKEMVEYHSRLGKLRASCSALWDGDFINAYAQGKRLAYVRYDHETAIYCVYSARIFQRAGVLRLKAREPQAVPQARELRIPDYRSIKQEGA